MSIENYRLDGEPRALYYADYRATYNRVKDVLRVGEVVPEDTSVSFVGNNGLLPTFFDLRRADKQPIANFMIPGKSAHVTFTDDCNVACGALFDRDARRTDHLYTVYASALSELGYLTYYLPLPNMPLHLRVVHEAQLENREAPDIPYRIRVAAATLLGEHQIC